MEENQDYLDFTDIDDAEFELEYNITEKDDIAKRIDQIIPIAIWNDSNFLDHYQKALKLYFPNIPYQCLDAAYGLTTFDIHPLFHANPDHAITVIGTIAIGDSRVYDQISQELIDYDISSIHSTSIQSKCKTLKFMVATMYALHCELLSSSKH